MRFRVLAGQHQEPDTTQKPIRVHVDSETGEKVKRYPVRTYNPGDIVETEKDLASMFGADKFERLDGERRGKRQVQRPMDTGRHDRAEDFDDNELQQEMIDQGVKSPKDLKGFEKTPTKNQPNVLQATAFAKPTALEDSSSEEEDDSQQEDKESKSGSDTGSDLPLESQSEWSEDMTVPELKEYAQSRKIDVSGKVRKSEIIEAIKQHEDSE